MTRRRSNLSFALLVGGVCAIAGCQAEMSRLGVLLNFGEGATQFHHGRHYVDGMSPENRIATDFDHVRQLRDDRVVAKVPSDTSE